MRSWSRRGFLTVAGASLLWAGGRGAGPSPFAITTAKGGEGRFRVTILHVNDVHSRIEPVNVRDGTCARPQDEAENCFGGVARLATAIRERRNALRAAGEAVLTLDAGDQFQGSLFYTAYNGQAEVEFMNRIGFDAMALGNHEFDRGPDVLADFIEAAAFPVLSGNTVVDAGQRLGEALDERAILEAGGRRIGVLSVLTPATATIASPGPAVRFTDEIAYLRRAVGGIRAAGAEAVLLLSHVGFSRDQEIAAQVGGLSAIIGGHSHTLLSNSVDGAPAYATLIEDPDGQAVPVVQAYAYSKYLGEIALVFDEAGYVVGAEGDTRLLDDTIEPDREIAARIEELGGPVEALKATPVATVAAFVDGSRQSCRTGECAMGNLVADAMLAGVRDPAVTIAIHNAGGLRASLDAGQVTLGDVLTVLPFQNTLATMRLAGRDIVAALEAGLQGFGEGGGGFPQVAGLRFGFDPRRPAGGRIRWVEVTEGAAWVPIDPEAVYAVVTNDFLRGGGDGYRPFADSAIDAYDHGPGLDEAVADYLSDNAPYRAGLDNRIVDLSR